MGKTNVKGWKVKSLKRKEGLKEKRELPVGDRFKKAGGGGRKKT